jgi:hypothetical protein
VNCVSEPHWRAALPKPVTPPSVLAETNPPYPSSPSPTHYGLIGGVCQPGRSGLGLSGKMGPG